MRTQCVRPPGMYFSTSLPPSCPCWWKGVGWGAVGERPPTTAFKLLEQICPHGQDVPRGQDVTLRSHRHNPWVCRVSWGLGMRKELRETWAATPFPREKVPGLLNRADPLLSAPVWSHRVPLGVVDGGSSCSERQSSTLLLFSPFC